jgi:aryl-alcohol dehydrogenase-like predicted oxidoreductase/enamine deaminase RidA (YjgF/YER057c/UK114 family)
MNNVERCNLAPDLTISRVLTGLWQVADMERNGKPLDQTTAANAMETYVNAGLTTFDMADHYGSAEDIAGYFYRNFESGKRSAQLLTKWVPSPGPSSANAVRTAVETALDRMQTDCLDLLQFHAWNYSDPSWLDSLFSLQQLMEEGLIRHLGLTNFDAAHLRIVVHSGIKVVSNQVCYSLLDQRARGDLTKLCQEHGIKLLAFGTLAGGFLTDRWLGSAEPCMDELRTWSQMKYFRFISEAGGWDSFQELLQTVKRVAERHGASVANVAGRYILDQSDVGGIIIGARLGEREHIEENLRLFQFSLDEKSHNELDEAVKKLRPIPGDCGDEYRKEPYLTASGDLSHHVENLPPPYEALIREDGSTRVLSGTKWEKMAGYSRALRRGNQVWVSGTTATHGDRIIGGSDPAAQTHFIIDKIEGALQSLGSSLEDVVRTRVYVQDMRNWEAVARVHGERFGEIQPANALVQASLVGSAYLVEIEVDAVIE